MASLGFVVCTGISPIGIQVPYETIANANANVNSDAHAIAIEV
jgi:hypothetical protein